VFRNRNARAAGAGFLRSRVRPVVRRALARTGLLDRSPSADDEALKAKVYTDFFQMLCIDGDFDRAAVATTRRLIARSETSRARSITQVFQRYDELRPIADICLALCALDEPMPKPAWTLFTRNDLGLVVRWAANEYFQLAFSVDPAAAASSLTRVLSGEVPLDADPGVWIQIAYYGFSAGALDLAEQTLKRAETAMAKVTARDRRARLQARVSTLREWLERAARAAEPVDAPEDEIPVALVGFKHPDWSGMSRDLDDPIETLAALGHLLRHDGLRFSGDPGLVAAAERLRGDVPAERRVSGGEQTVRLFEVDRDVSQYAAVPPGTWMIVSEWFTQPLAGPRYDLPLNPTLRPIFISFHVNPDALSAPGAIEYLRKYAPIGCCDWDTVFLLLAAGVPAFFSGALTMTVDTVVPRASRPTSTTTFVDFAPDGPGEKSSRMSSEVKDRDLGSNLTAAADELRRYRDGGARVVTSDLRFALAARAVGCPSEFRPRDTGDHRVVDFLQLADDDFAAIQGGISDKLAAVLGAVLSGRSENEVYETWREVCAAEVKAAEAELHSVTWDPAPTFDLDQACKVIRSASVTVERSEPGPGGSEINVEFSVDQNYKHQLDIVLDSVVEHASRPVRAFVLCRGHGQDDFDRLARLFPTVSFVWLPTDNVSYGPIPDKIRWATIVTMDRTMLPVLLGDVDRIIHFDLDALCLSDLAELFDVDLEGTAIAAVDAPQPVYLGGLDTFRRAVRRHRREGNLDIARELIIRTHSQHQFDFEIFNAGIMVLDLAKMRADDVCQRFLGYIQRFGINGQVIMNVYVGRNRKKVDADWNRLVRLEVAGPPKVAHWAGPYKPWRDHHYVTARELWRDQEERFAARTEHLLPVRAPRR
jgi:lipopolysaccharide biosynthesis glycosyltransferase